MTAAIALAVVLVIAVAGASMALESQKGQPTSAARRPPRPPRPETGPSPMRKGKDRTKRGAPDPTAADGPPVFKPEPEPEIKAPDLLRTGQSAAAKVISVVDERTIGPVTRSRLKLLLEPAGGSPFEVTLRFAFPTQEARALVKVGGTVPVRYDADDHSRVVIDLPSG